MIKDMWKQILVWKKSLKRNKFNKDWSFSCSFVKAKISKIIKRDKFEKTSRFTTSKED
jgi:hypothetical protein